MPDFVINGGYSFCLSPGCEEIPRLSGYCPKHDCVYWGELLDMPKYYTVADDVATIKALMKNLTPEQRLEVFNNYCTSCGGTEHPCHCMRDE